MPVTPESRVLTVIYGSFSEKVTFLVRKRFPEKYCLLSFRVFFIIKISIRYTKDAGKILSIPESR